MDQSDAGWPIAARHTIFQKDQLVHFVRLARLRPLHDQIEGFLPICAEVEVEAELLELASDRKAIESAVVGKKNLSVMLILRE